MQKSNNDIYTSNGVFIRPSIPHSAEEVKIIYNGLLPKSGATEIYAHIGIGGKWEKTKEIRMNKTIDGFEAEVPARHASALYVTFHDSASNWDNNNGYNYIFSLN